MAPSFDSTQFRQIIRIIAESGAFKDFDPPLGVDDPDSDFEYPRYPGQVAYMDGGPGRVMAGEDLPQSLIDAQRKSVHEAIRLYMPQDIIADWIHPFFATESDFLNSDASKYLLDFLKFTPAGNEMTLPDDYTMDFTRGGRNRHETIFTRREVLLAYEVCCEVPSIPLTLIAYQACFLQYLYGLKEAMEQLPEGQDKERGRDALNTLTKDWQTNNFMHVFVPAVALSYLKNHGNEIGDPPPPPTQQDFMDGVKFAYENEVFKLSVAGRNFSCPAGPIIVRNSGSYGVETDMGLFRVYNAVQDRIVEGYDAGGAMHRMYNEFEQADGQRIHKELGMEQEGLQPWQHDVQHLVPRLRDLGVSSAKGGAMQVMQLKELMLMLEQQAAQSRSEGRDGGITARGNN